jgi:DNA-binding MarR family transcriptional regulator
VKSLHDLQDGALTRFFAVGAVLGPAMEQGLTEQGLTSARAEVVWRLHHLGPMTQRQLSDALQCTPRNVTGLVDALEDSGLVERHPHPTDRRAIHVTLTEQGEAAAADWTSRSRQLARQLFSDVNRDDLETLITTIDLVLDQLDAPRP